jgi:hypothetical protein
MKMIPGDGMEPIGIVEVFIASKNMRVEAKMGVSQIIPN